MKQRVFVFLNVLMGVCFFSFSGQAQIQEVSEPDELVLAVHPYLPIVELHKRFTPLVQYLQEKTGKKIRIKVSENFSDHKEKVGKDQVDFSFLEAPHYVMITGRYGKKNLLAGLEINGSSVRHVMFVVRKDSSISSLADLSGKKVALHGHASYGGHLLTPEHMFEQAGISMDQVTEAKFLGSHRNVAMAVLTGHFDAGVIKEEVYVKLQERGLRVLEKSGPIQESFFAASSTLSPRLAEILRESLLGLKDTPGGREILEAIQEAATACVSLDESSFEQMRIMMSSPTEGKK